MSAAFFTPATASIPARTFSDSTYDALNRLSTLSEGTRTTSYAYDLNGNLLTKTLPNSETVRMAYDGLNRMFSEQGLSPTGPLYNYLTLCDAAGNLRFSSEVNAGIPMRTLVLSYDNADRLTSEKAFNANNSVLSETIHGYDAANNRKTKTVGGVVTSYAYNSLNQLTGWSDTAGATASYGYDFNGNRSSRTLAGVSDSYSYDLENRLTSLTKNTSGGTGTYGYVYDYRTRRVGRTENSTTTNIVFSGGTSVQEYVSNSLTAEYIRGSDWGGGVGGILYSMRSGNPSFAHYNRRGDVTSRTDSTGVITYQASYQADGRRTAEFGSTLDRQKANTKEEDPTGLLNEGQRIRDLETLTFTTRDPAGFVDGPNLYSYVTCNPFSKFDPEGLFMFGLYDSAGDYASDVGTSFAGIGTGMYQAGRGAVVGLATSVRDLPSNTMGVIGGIGELAQMDGGVVMEGIKGAAVQGGQNVAQGVSNAADTMTNGTLEQKSQLFGNGLGNAAMIAAPIAKGGAVAEAGSIEASASKTVAKTEQAVAARAGAGAGDEMVTVFRGVHAEHPQLGNALQGKAAPWGGHSDPVLHNAWDNRSIFTSWTTDQATAVRFATENGPGGVMLRQTVPRSSLIKSPDALREFEVLRTGPIDGATPIILSK